MASDEFLVPPPASMTVDHERRPVLYLPDGRVLVRQAGFQAPPREAPMPCHGGKKKGGRKGRM